jgi:hypothetical protein
MTVRSASLITQCAIVKETETTLRITVEDDGYGPLTLWFSGRNQKQAAQRLVDAVYRLRCERVMERDGWKCVRCGRTTNLQCHHKIHRAHGRRDTMDNMETLGAECHDKEHRGMSRPVQLNS